MRSGRARAIAELYDATDRLVQPKITPILEGTCRIQGPIDAYEYDPQRTDLGNIPVETNCMNELKDPHTTAELGTCNVCSAPCSLCLHFNQSSSLMESNLEGGPSDTISFRKDDSLSFVSASVVKRKAPPKRKSANTETSNSVSSSSSHDSSVENAETKETFRASVLDDPSENVAASPKGTSDIVGNNNFLHEQAGSSDGSKTSELHCWKASDIIDEKHKEKCHNEDNFLIAEFDDSNNVIHDRPRELDKKVVGSSPRSTDSSVVKNDEKSIQNEVIHDCSNSEPEMSQAESKGNGKFSMKNSATSSSRDVMLCHNAGSGEDLDSSSNVSPKTHSPCPGSPRNLSLSQPSMDNEKSLIKEKPFGGGVDVEKVISLGEVSKEDSGKSQAQLFSSKGSDECMGLENNNIAVSQSGDAIKPQDNYKQSDKLDSDSDMPQVPLQPNSECEVSAETEDDVNVCDICGDAGKEESLAFCSRCSDGAEHIYCMRIKLDKVPEGDWLCEECQLKEARNHMIGNSEPQLEATEAPCLDGNSQNIEITSKCLPCPENKAIDPDIRSDSKELVKSVLSTRKKENSEVNSASDEKISETCGASNEVIPRKPPLLSPENLNKPDIVKAKPTSMLVSSENLEGISKPGVQRQASDFITFKQQEHFDQIRGPLSKSVSFNNSKVPKVKQLLENIPKKAKNNRESNSSNTKNQGPFQTITKSASFRSESSGFFVKETINRVQSLNSLRSEDPQGVKLKDRSIVDKKNSTSTSDRCFVSPAVPASSVPSLKDSKVQQCDAKLKRTLDSSNLGDNRNDATILANEVQKQQPSSSLSRRSTSLVRLCKNENQKPFQLVSKAAELTQRDDKTKGNTFSSNSKPTASVGNRLSHCHKCNGKGHTAQFCAVDKLPMASEKPSSERSLRDMDNKSVKWKNAAEWLSWKYGTKMTAKSPDKSEEVSLSSAVINSEVASKGFALSSLGSEIFPPVEGASDVQDFSKVTNNIQMEEKVEDHNKSTLLDSKETAPGFAADLDMQSIIQSFPDRASISILPLRDSGIPELGHIWQGAFEVLSSFKPPAIFDGFQAHLSTYVSPKAVELASQFPCKVQLEEVPRLSSWPLQFHENGPKEDNVALFFFAKDSESYENFYLKLLENMLNNDLALVGNFDAVELLIFPSTLLPENSQRWNKLYYLWGVFRGRKKENLGDLSGLEKKHSVSDLNLEPTVQNPTLIVAGLYSPHCVSDKNNQDVLLSGRLHNTNVAQSGTCIDLRDTPALGNENRIFNKEQPLIEKILHQAVADDNLLRKQSYLASVPISKLQIDIEQLPSEMENDTISLDKNSSDSGSKKGPEGHVNDCSKRLNNCEDRTCSVALNCWQGNDGSVQKIKRKEIFLPSKADLDNQLSKNIIKMDYVSRESLPNWNHTQSHSVETIKNSSGHLLLPTADTILWTDESSCTSLSDEKEHKKARIDNGQYADCRSREETLSSKIEPINGSTNSSIYYEAVSESSKNAERYFFPIDSGPTTSAKADNLIYVLSSDDEDSPESNAPNLELALGGKSRMIKQDILTLSSRKVGEKRKRDELSAPAAVDGDDTHASLSLSLAFPASKAQTAKTSSETEQILPDKPCISTLLLFGGCTDT